MLDARCCQDSDIAAGSDARKDQTLLACAATANEAGAAAARAWMTSITLDMAAMADTTTTNGFCRGPPGRGLLRPASRGGSGLPLKASVGWLRFPRPAGATRTRPCRKTWVQAA
jgi:hypothetical protein